MCGIAGLATRDGLRPDDRRLVDDMLATLAHRGPDEQRVFQDEHVAFGTRRLSIIDLDTGSQPLGNEDGSIQVSQNGEIYNYVELREELLRRGHTLRTTGDTEVIVHLYEELRRPVRRAPAGHVRDRALGRPPPAARARPRPAGQEADLLGAARRTPRAGAPS